MESAPASPRRLALFDLDGTLSRHDTFVPFVLGLLWRNPARWLRLPLLLAPLLGYTLGRMDRGALKGAILHRLFAGLPRSRVASWAGHFAAQAVRHRMHEDGVRVLRSHLAAGDQVVLLSASPDLYVPLLGQALGVHETHCTQVRWNGDRLDGRLAGPNRRDAEKSRVLETLRVANPDMAVIAYGNSQPDLDHMLRCEEAVYVNPSARQAAQLAAAGLRCAKWR